MQLITRIEGKTSKLTPCNFIAAAYCSLGYMNNVTTIRLLDANMQVIKEHVVLGYTLHTLQYFRFAFESLADARQTFIDLEDSILQTH